MIFSPTSTQSAPFSPSLISLMVSVPDAKHHVYLLLLSAEFSHGHAEPVLVILGFCEFSVKSSVTGDS